MKISPELAELVGVIMGDGYIYSKYGTHQVGIVGSPVTDREYFERLKEMILKVWDKDVKIKERERGLRMILSSKEIVQRLVNDFKIPSGKKSDKIILCDKIFHNWDLAKHTIRGLVDTDGSVFVSKKPGVLNYPCIELNTGSKELAFQLKNVLMTNGFRVASVQSRIAKNGYKNSKISFKVSLNGQKNLKKWIDEIGFSNPYKLKRATSYLRN